MGNVQYNTGTMNEALLKAVSYSSDLRFLFKLTQCEYLRVVLLYVEYFVMEFPDPHISICDIL
jgi:hypothetical protein